MDSVPIMNMPNVTKSMPMRRGLPLGRGLGLFLLVLLALLTGLSTSMASSS
jgi:hypothetical protein